jgi:glutaryl-CoA dehydrogenase
MSFLFEAPDFFDINELLNPEEQALRDTVRAFVNEEVLPIISDCFIHDIFPRQLIPSLAKLGIFGSSIDGYGCVLSGSVARGLISQELERGDSGLRSFVSVQDGLCMYAIHKYGDEMQKAKYLAKLATGEMVGCFAVTESHAGSDPTKIQMRAQKDGKDYILNGRKMWITNGSIADIAIIWVKVPGETALANERIQAFILEKDTPGLSTRDIDKKFSLRTAITSELILEDCRVPATQLINAGGLNVLFDCLSNARFGISWGAIGSAMACYSEALNYAKSRVQFDRPIAGFQLVQSKLVTMFTEITKAQLMALRVGRLRDQGRATNQQISMAKMNNVAMALACARSARDILGAAGTTHNYHCGRHMLNLESVSTYEGSENIHCLILGEHVTGIPAFR